MKLLNWDNVILLSPHPDDIEVSMGGTILKYKHTRFSSVVFSTGSVNDPVANEDRWRECDQYWAGTYHVKQYFLAPLMKMYSEEEWINLLENRFSMNQFNAIFLPPGLDTHYEHRFVNGIGMALTRATPAAIIEYKAISALDTWTPNMFIEIGDQAEEKIKRLEKFQSQNKTYFQTKFMQAFHNHPSSIRKGVGTTEQFRIVGLYQAE